ncbi:hypothetical protein RhiirA4_469847 [Rhizophagus irregularis]|uniref:Uncharacterized protein n=1 Tax=Rhizophagus irregularis TaxID=588596 RepID=A0A2I1H088_9GLOM|nr:hypothetical protein RhiirA4_469847 [Rhizophagus irregularis]
MFDAKFELKDIKRRYNCGGIGTQQKKNAQSEDEQFEDALTSPKLNAVSIVLRSKEEHENYNNLNNEFSKRMKEISNNEKETSSKTCDKDNVDSEDDNLNENKKHIMKSQSVREHADDE